MAYKRKTRKKTMRKKTYKRKQTVTTGGTAKIPYPKDIVDFGFAFPKRCKIKQVYTDTVTLTSTSGVPVNYQFVLNGLFDPNISTSGHQPLYLDQLLSIWSHYTVIGCKMTVKFIPYETNVVPASVVLWQNDDSATTPSVISNYQEQSGASFTIIGSAGDTYQTLVLKYSPKKVFGGSILGNPVLQGTASINPTEISVGQITMVGADNATTVSVIAQVVLEYISIYSELKDITTS